VAPQEAESPESITPDASRIGLPVVTVRTEALPRQRLAVPDATPRPQPGLRGVAIVVSAVLALLVDGTSTATINTGLPYLQAITAASPDEASWIVSAFNAAYYPAILLSPWMMARVGRRRLMLVALVGFSLTSFVLAGTSNYGVFLVLRFVQGGLLGCVFVPAALLLFTSLHRDVLKFAPPAFVFVSLTGGTVGTLIGGFFADEYGAGWVFIPGCIATLTTAILIAVAVKNTDEPQPDLHFDTIGITLSVVSFGALQFLANEGERRNWFDDPGIVLAAAILAVALPAFVLYELFLTREPHVDFRMFARHRNLAVGGTVNVAVGAVGYSVTILVAYLQTATGATPTIAGALVLVRLATYAIGVPAAFLLITARKFDIRLVVIIGALGSSLGLTIFSRRMTSTADLAAFVGVSLLFGFFFGMMNQPLGALVIGSMPLPLLAAGVSIYKLSSPVGLMIATGGMQTVLADRTAAFRSDVAGLMTLARAPVGRYVREHHGHASGLAGLVALQSQTLAYAYVMQLFAFVVLAVVPIVLLAAVRKPGAPPANV
jgi:DHA2 family multidrug resistance protein